MKEGGQGSFIRVLGFGKSLKKSGGVRKGNFLTLSIAGKTIKGNGGSKKTLRAETPERQIASSYRRTTMGGMQNGGTHEEQNRRSPVAGVTLRIDQQDGKET